MAARCGGAQRQSPGHFEIVAAGASATAGFNGITLYADTLNNIDAARLTIGGDAAVEYGQAGNIIGLHPV